MTSLTPIRLSTMRRVCLGVAFSSITGTLIAQESIGSPLQTADSAAQISSGLPSSLPGATLVTSTVGSSYPSLGRAQVYWQPQPTVLWVPDVEAEHPEVFPPVESFTGRPRPNLVGDTSTWRSTITTIVTAQPFPTGRTVFQQVSLLTLGSATADVQGDTSENNMDANVEASEASPLAATSGDHAIDATSGFTSTLPNDFLITSCLDSAKGCSDPTIPIIPAMLEPHATGSASLLDLVAHPRQSVTQIPKKRASVSTPRKAGHSPPPDSGVPTTKKTGDTRPSF